MERIEGVVLGQDPQVLSEDALAALTAQLVAGVERYVRCPIDFGAADWAAEALRVRGLLRECLAACGAETAGAAARARDALETATPLLQYFAENELATPFVKVAATAWARGPAAKSVCEALGLVFSVGNGEVHPETATKIAELKGLVHGVGEVLQLILKLPIASVADPLGRFGYVVRCGADLVRVPFLAVFLLFNEYETCYALLDCGARVSEWCWALLAAKAQPLSVEGESLLNRLLKGDQCRSLHSAGAYLFSITTAPEQGSPAAVHAAMVKSAGATAPEPNRVLFDFHVALGKILGYRWRASEAKWSVALAAAWARRVETLDGAPKGIDWAAWFAIPSEGYYMQDSLAHAALRGPCGADRAVAAALRDGLTQRGAAISFLQPSLRLEHFATLVADVNTPVNLQCKTLLMQAAKDPKLGWAVQELLDAGADVNATYKGGQTALHYAAKAGNREAFALIACKGADPMKADNGGVTAWGILRNKTLHH
eukprot:TRINITY_DN17274_c0_g1_i1.p1 TRINITY_DN17274_c0_g1~~TRINITY_DN17274_c0_g1_i1.p1  ORF type:complete len:487 (-),score=114.18 TRINITY_DN17274_c0_g1_i1:84-1544(-)